MQATCQLYYLSSLTPGFAEVLYIFYSLIMLFYKPKVNNNICYFFFLLLSSLNTRYPISIQIPYKLIVCLYHFFWLHSILLSIYTIIHSFVDEQQGRFPILTTALTAEKFNFIKNYYHHSRKCHFKCQKICHFSWSVQVIIYLSLMKGEKKPDIFSR